MIYGELVQEFFFKKKKKEEPVKAKEDKKISDKDLIEKNIKKFK